MQRGCQECRRTNLQERKITTLQSKCTTAKIDLRRKTKVKPKPPTAFQRLSCLFIIWLVGLCRSFLLIFLVGSRGLGTQNSGASYAAYFLLLWWLWLLLVNRALPAHTLASETITFFYGVSTIVSTIISTIVSTMVSTIVSTIVSTTVSKIVPTIFVPL